MSSDVVEARLLQAIVDGDAGSRQVYADWLEEHEELDRAELLRILDRVVDMPRAPSFDLAFDDLTRRLAVVASGIEVEWRRLVARDAIEKCRPFADLTWLIDAAATRPARHASGFELPEQLRYLEGLAPAPQHEPMTPRVQSVLELASTVGPRVLGSLLAALRARLE